MMTKSEHLAFFNLPESASESEIRAAYEELKSKFSAQRFMAGEQGNIAAKNLTTLEESFDYLMSELAAKKNAQIHGTEYGSVLELVKADKLNEAQKLLDESLTRGAEHHYFQALIFYRRHWYMESRNQLRIALDIEPQNQKYIEALKKLEQEMASPVLNPATINFENRPPNSIPLEKRNELSNCCTTWCIINCCCNLLYFFFRN